MTQLVFLQWLMWVSIAFAVISSTLYLCALRNMEGKKISARRRLKIWWCELTTGHDHMLFLIDNEPRILCPWCHKALDDKPEIEKLS